MPRAPVSALSASAPIIAALEVGETWSKIERLDGDEANKEAINSTLAALRNNAARPVARARENTLGDYETTTFVTRTQSFDVLVGIAVTRTA